MSLQVKIVTPSKVAFEDAAEEVQIPGWSGEYGALPDHANMLTLTRPGIVTLFQAKGNLRVLVGKGIAEVGSKHISLLVDVFEHVEDIDKTAAMADLESAMAQLDQIDITDASYAFAKNRVELAQARVEA